MMKKNVFSIIALGFLLNGSLLKADHSLQFDDENCVLIGMSPEKPGMVGTQEINQLGEYTPPSSAHSYLTRTKNALSTLGSWAYPWGETFIETAVAGEAAFVYGGPTTQALLWGATAMVSVFDPSLGTAAYTAGHALNRMLDILPGGQAVRGAALLPITNMLAKPMIKLGSWGITSTAQGFWNFGQRLTTLVSHSSSEAPVQMTAIVNASVPAIANS